MLDVGLDARRNLVGRLRRHAGALDLHAGVRPGGRQRELPGQHPVAPRTVEMVRQVVKARDEHMALAVDQAGNVWIAGSGNTFITEIVGGAVPIYQPYAVGIAVNRFQSIP